MLKIEKKDYEVEEDIQLVEEGKIIYEFKMKITNEELEELKYILFNFAKENRVKYAQASDDEKEALEIEAGKQIIANDGRFIDICFKEHKEAFIEKAGQYKFDETVETMRNYFIDFFMKKTLKPLDILNSDLMRNINVLAKLK